MLGKFFEKIPTDDIYKDLFQPGMQKAGEALSTVIDISNSILLPIKLLNERSRVIFENNLRRYSEKVNKIKNDELHQVPEYVGLPIIDKLTYLTDTTLSESFINLLTKASNKSTLELVHPAFISTLNDLSKDEATILFAHRHGIDVPFIDVYVSKYIEKIEKPNHLDLPGPKTREQLKESVAYRLQDRHESKLRVAWNLTALEYTVPLDFPGNIDIYLYNLERHKLIEFERNVYLTNEIAKYEQLETEHYTETISNIRESTADPKGGSETGNVFVNVVIERGSMSFTDYGKAFLKACMNEISNEVS